MQTLWNLGVHGECEFQNLAIVWQTNYRSNANCAPVTPIHCQYTQPFDSMWSHRPLSKPIGLVLRDIFLIQSRCSKKRQMIPVKEQSTWHTSPYELTQHFSWNLFFKLQILLEKVWHVNMLKYWFFFFTRILAITFFSNSRQILSMQTSKDIHNLSI